MMPARSSGPERMVPGDREETSSYGPTMLPTREFTPQVPTPAPGAVSPDGVPTEIKTETQPYFGLPSKAPIPSSEPCQVGDALGSYVLEELLGQGGMGAVFRARHQILGREVAIKVLLPVLSLQPDLVRRFFQEAQAINLVHHPNVVEITDCVFPQDRPPYLVMQYLAGQPLSQLIRDEAPLAPEVVIDLGLQICSAMEAVHARGIVHRDLKPDNIFLVPNPRPDLPGEHLVKLLDFGIAKFLTPEADLVKTRTGAIIGTPEYMAPEQISSGRIDHRTDLYSLGAILFELLTGRPPFAAPQIGQLLLKQLGEAPVAPSTRRPASRHCPIPEELDQAVLRCLAKDKDQRVQTMGDLGVILARARGACTGPVVVRVPTQAMQRADRSDLLRRRRWPVLVSAMLGAALLVAAVGGWLSMRRPPAPTRADAVSAQVRLPGASAVAPARLMVQLTSSPAGAVAFDLASGQALGPTPLPVQVTEGLRRSVELRLAGHAPRRLELPSDGAAVPIVDLTPLAPPLPPPSVVSTTVHRTAAARPREAPRERTRPRPVRPRSPGGRESVTVNPFE